MSLVTLADAKDFLNITTSTHDTRLQRYVDAASSMIAKRVGPVNPVSVSEVHDGGGTFVMLRQPPVLSVTTLVEYIGLQPYTLTLQPLGSTTSMWGYSLSKAEGKLVRRGSTGDPIPFQGGRQSVAVTYLAGVDIDPAVYLAVLEDIRGLWSQTQNGPGQNPYASEQQDNTWAPVGMFPRLAAILADFTRVQALA